MWGLQHQRERPHLGKFAAGFIEVFGKVIQVAVVPLDLFHGLSLALGVKVEALADNLKTHYGHETPGQPLQFPVRVRMLDDLTDVQVNCGWLVGITFPKQGPIPNIKMQWFTGDPSRAGPLPVESARLARRPATMESRR